MNFNENVLLIYRGSDIKINDYITIHHPTLGEICDYGEIKYYSFIHTLCAVGADLKWQLWEAGIDYTKISDYELFYSLLYRQYTHEQTSIIFGDLNISSLRLFKDDKMEEYFLVDENNHVIIDRMIYQEIVSCLRKIHNLKRNDEMPANERTKTIFIEDAKEEYEQNKNKPYKSFLTPLISSMVNSEGFKFDINTVFDMKIFPFMDSVMRINKMKNADLLLQSGYSGFGVDLKKIKKEHLDWMGNI